MKKIFLIILAFVSLNVSAQDATAPDLQQINASAKNTYIKVEALDKITQELKYFDDHQLTGKEQQQLLLETYRAVANGYSINNHFKQGYTIYIKYLSIKENYLAAEKAEAISKINQSIEEQQRKDADELIAMHNTVQQLQLDNENLETKRKSFKHLFSLIIIGLTVIFAFLLLQTGLKLNKIKHDLKAGRERLEKIHRIAVFGKLKNGISFTFNSILASLKNNSAENIKLTDQLNQLSGGKNHDLTQLQKQLNELSRLTEQLNSENV